MRKMLVMLFSMCAAASSLAQEGQDGSEALSDISAGPDVVCTINTLGQANCETGVNRLDLTPPSNLPTVLDIAAAKSFVCAIVGDNREARCWGSNDFGQQDIPSDATALTKITVGEAHACAIRENGNAVCWGLDTNERTVPPNNGARYKDIAAGEFHTCAVRLNGDVDCWGAETDSFVLPPADLPAAEKIESAWKSSCILSTEGDIHCWGAPVDIGIPVQGSPYTDLAYGFGQVCGLSLDGSIDCVVTSSSSELPTNAVIEAAAANAGPFIEIDLGLSGTTFFGDPNRVRFTGCGVTTSFERECWVGSATFTDVNTNGAVGFVPELTAIQYSDTTAELLWNRPEEIRFFDSEINIRGYNVFRNGELLEFVTTRANYIDETLEVGQTYEYQVQTVSISGHTDPLSNVATISTVASPGDNPSELNNVDRPLTPTSLQAIVYGPNSLELFWDRPEVSFKGYEVRLNGETVNFTPGTSQFFTGLPENQAHNFIIIGINPDDSIGGVESITVDLTEAQQCT